MNPVGVPVAARAEPARLDSWGRALFEAIDDAVFIHDQEGRLLDANPAACRRLGYARDELLALTTHDIDEPEFAAGFRERLQSQLADGHLVCEGRHVTKDGRVIPVEINTSAIEVDGQPAVLAVIRDITDRKRAEESLRKQKQTLQSILDHMADGVIVADQNERFLVFNPAAERMFGMGSTESTSSRWPRQYGLYLPDMHTPFPPDQLPLLRAIRGQEVDDVVMFVRHARAPDGIWASITGRPLRDDQGHIRGGAIVCRDITDRQRAQDEIHRINHFLDSIVETIPNMLFVKEAAGLRFERINKACESVLGLCREDLIGKTDYDLFPREQADFFTRKDREVLAGRKLVEISEEAIQTLDGPRVFHTRKLPILDEKGEPCYLLGISEDVTERKALEETRRQYTEAREQHARELEAKNQALEDSEALYHSLVECLPQNIYRKDQGGHFTFANHRFCATLGKPLDDILGRTLDDLVPPDQARKYRSEDLVVLQSGQPLEEIDEQINPDGSRRYFQVVKTPIRDSHGQIIGTQGIFWDVTETRQAQEALIESERRYRHLTEAALDAIVVVDEHERITLFNRAAERTFGYRAEEILNQSVRLLIPQANRQRHAEGFGRFLATRDPRVVGRTVELNGLRKDGTEFPLELSLSAVDLGGELQFLGAIRDLTERHRMRTAMIQNEKLASIGLLSAGVAHEINNPLAYVANNLVVLERDTRGLLALLEVYEQAHDTLAQARPDLVQRVQALAEEVDLPYVRANFDRLLTRTRDGVNRVTRIVRSLSSLARTAPPELQQVSIPDLVDGSLEIIGGQLRRRGIEVEQRHADLGKVRCVPNQLSQVLLNLLVNAMHAIEARADSPGGRIRLTTERAGDELVIEVADNGCGIDARDLPRLFDPFFTTKPVGEGTGLGLSITHNIVTGHGGRIEVDSRPGAGSRFRVFLPLAR